MRVVARSITRDRPADARHKARGSKDSSAGWVAAAFEAALQARAPGVHASTPMVRQLAVKISRELGLDPQSQALLDVAVRVRDIGMLALPDSAVLATTPLSPSDLELIHRHPVIGAQLLNDFPSWRPLRKSSALIMSAGTVRAIPMGTVAMRFRCSAG